VNRKIPIYGNTKKGSHCWQACLKMVLKYFYPTESFSYKKLDKLTNHVPNKDTWPFAGLIWLKKKGLEVKYFTNEDVGKFSREGARYFRKVLANDEYEYVIRATFNMNEEMRLARQVIDSGILTKGRISFNLIEGLMKRGYVVVSWVNSRVLNGKAGVAGHFVVLLSVRKGYVYFNDPGDSSSPAAQNRRTTKKLFAKAANQSKTSWAVYAFKTKDKS
jgi:hypothetical protein